MKTFDLAVIGAGPAGYTAALDAAAIGKTVVCIEREDLGGTCLNRGCIPTKAIIESAIVYKKALKAQDYGIEANVTAVNYAKIRERAEAAISRLSKGVEFLFKQARVEYIRADAKILAGNIVELRGSDGNDSQIKAENILIATGARQKKNPAVFQAGGRILTSREALKLDFLPESVVVMGGGAIGLEFAWIWNSFGVKVTVVEFEKNILPTANGELSKGLERALKKQGIAIKTGCQAKEAYANDASVTVRIADASGNTEDIEAQYALWACGMEAETNGLFVGEAVPKTCDRGFVIVDSEFRTSLENIYAAGDITGGAMLAHAAMTEANCAVASMFKKEKMTPGAVPACVFTQPQAASVGISENAETMSAVKIPYMANGKAVASDKTEGFLKIVYEKNSGTITGAHILGEDASELISNFVIAVDKKLSCKDIAKMTFPHPTLGELILDAARSVM